MPQRKSLSDLEPLGRATFDQRYSGDIGPMAGPVPLYGYEGAGNAPVGPWQFPLPSDPNAALMELLYRQRLMNIPEVRTVPGLFEHLKSRYRRD